MLTPAIGRLWRHPGVTLGLSLLLAFLLALLAGPCPAAAQILEVVPAHTSPGLPTVFYLITDGRYAQVELTYTIGGVEQTVLVPTDSCDGPGGACSLSYTLPATTDLGTACFKRHGDTPDSPCAPFSVVAGPVLGITALSPASTPAGGPGFTLTITGWGFFDYAPNAWFDDTFIEPIDIQFSSDTEMQVAIPAELIATAGLKTVALEGLWALHPTATFTVTPPSFQAALNLGPLVQEGPNVLAPIAWDRPVTNGTIDCGTTPSQTISDPGGGPCVYTTPGTFTVTGAYWDGTQTQHPEPVAVDIPALPPAGAHLRVDLADGAVPAHDLSGPFPLATMTTPSIYPVPVQLSLTVDPPASGTVGIADPLDLTTSRLRIKPIAVPADLTAPWSTSDAALILQAGTDANHLQASTALTRFAQNGTDPSHWRQRFILVGHTLHGTPLSTELSLQGSVGDGSQVSFTVKRVNPIYPYTPTTYLYEVPTLAGGVPGEPMTQTWSITGDNETRPVKSLQGPGNFAVTYTTPGQKSITLTAGGPFSGWKPWTDSVTVPQAPPVGPVAFYVTPPRYNRPPATYRFAPNYPPLAPGERITGDPTWSVDGQPVFTGAIFYSTFTAAGPHTVTLSQPTTLPRLLGGSTTITVDPNQVPVGSIDCSGSYLDKTTTPKTYVLSCKAVNTSDPDGQIVSLVWTLPDVPYQKAGGSYVHYGFPSPQVVPVQMVLTDNSGGTATISTSVDLSTVR